MRFDPLKAIQAAAVVLAKHDGRMTRLRLLNILVLADREALQETLESITADEVSAMDNGLILSATYDMIKQDSSHSSLWDRYIARDGGRYHLLIDNPGVGQLSQCNIEKLQEICDRWANKPGSDLVGYMHKLPEWKRNEPSKGSSRPVPLDHILEALDMADQAERIKATIRESDELDRIFGGVGSD